MENLKISQRLKLARTKSVVNSPHPRLAIAKDHPLAIARRFHRPEIIYCRIHLDDLQFH